MKGLRKLAGLFLTIIVLGFALAACGGNSKQEAADQKARGEVVAKAAAEQQKQREEEKKKADAEAEQQARERRAERRAELIMEIRAAFDPKAEVPGDQPTWVRELRSSKPQSVVEACAKLEKFREVDWALKHMDLPEAEDQAEDPISWPEIGLEAHRAKNLHRETGLATAKSLLAFFSLPRKTRQEAECGRGEGVFGLHDGIRLMWEISRILQAIEAKPKAIGSSTEMLRQVLLKDLREQIVYLRSEIKAGRVKASDGGAEAIRYVAQEATRSWSFTPKELGLTTEEVAMLHQKKND
ncbi:hypothetical protein HYW67_02820 [Candidatus Parcubacteria bacterium]|nr:hypothetical protein [Candidatus Parcubacteria bacterium]